METIARKILWHLSEIYVENGVEIGWGSQEVAVALINTKLAAELIPKTIALLLKRRQDENQQTSNDWLIATKIPSSTLTRPMIYKQKHKFSFLLVLH